uniref:Cyclin C-terminal domain-containing protein n=1 Tax=Clastoptera arizonana TaxID=38151 RepID=A0A1B6DMW8_9HEMI
MVPKLPQNVINTAFHYYERFFFDSVCDGTPSKRDFTLDVIKDPERFCLKAKNFMDKLLLTKAYILYAPAQIALGSLALAVSESQETIEPYLNILLSKYSKEEKENLTKKIMEIAQIKLDPQPPPKEVIEILELRLNNCKNQLH